VLGLPSRMERVAAPEAGAQAQPRDPVDRQYHQRSR